KSIHWCITMAISDFYALHLNYRTRLLLHTRDSKGDPIEALSAVDSLLNNTKVQAIIGPKMYLQSKLLAMLADRAKVPIFFFCCSILNGIPLLVPDQGGRNLMTYSMSTKLTGLSS
ncbi:glutamate receptor 1.2-like protein, partial [Tanacetum coccineum]